MIKINYVIATWTGNRRKGNDPHRTDRTWYLKEHLRLLKKYKHSLNQITIVAPHYKQEPAEVSNYLESINGITIQTAPVVLLRRENKGHSYGSYSDAFSKYPDFDYYILIEDDYVFVKDNFDRTMVDMFEGKPNCGFLCCLVKHFGDRLNIGPLHAAISNGIASKESLQRVWDLKGEIPSSDFTDKYHCQSQLQFSQGFIDAGFQLYDFTDRCNVVFNNTGELQRFGFHPEYLVVALQFKTTFPELLG